MLRLLRHAAAVTCRYDVDFADTPLLQRDAAAALFIYTPRGCLFSLMMPP